MRRVQDGLLLPLLLLHLWGSSGQTVGSQGSPGLTLHSQVFLESLSFGSPLCLGYICCFSPTTALNHDTTSSVSASPFSPGITLPSHESASYTSSSSPFCSCSYYSCSFSSISSCSCPFYSPCFFCWSKLMKHSRNHKSVLQRLRLQTKLEVHQGCVNTLAWNRSSPPATALNYHALYTVQHVE